MYKHNDASRILDMYNAPRSPIDGNALLAPWSADNDALHENQYFESEPRPVLDKSKAL